MNFLFVLYKCNVSNTNCFAHLQLMLTQLLELGIVLKKMILRDLVFIC